MEKFRCIRLLQQKVRIDITQRRTHITTYLQSKKNMSKENKIFRENLKLTEQMSEMLKSGSKDLQMPKNKLVTIALFDFLQNSNNFVICESCKKKICIKQELPGGSGVLEISCKCGKTNWYDSENNKILKVK